MRKLAERLIAHETPKNKTHETQRPADFSAVAKLRPQLSTLMGNAGFDALLLRAGSLGGLEVAWLREVKIKSDGFFEGLDELESRVGLEKIIEGKVVLLAQLLGLLQTFIGEILTLRLVIEVWPKLSLDEFDSGMGEKK